MKFARNCVLGDSLRPLGEFPKIFLVAGKFLGESPQKNAISLTNFPPRCAIFLQIARIAENQNISKNSGFFREFPAKLPTGRGENQNLSKIRDLVGNFLQ